MPKVLGRYHIISELGRGGMGVVYKAVDPKLERFIAIKCLSDELSSDEITVTRFLREARNVAALNHPHIAQIFLADEDEGKPYFVMEYVDGESLAERLAREKRLMPEQALRIVSECAEALKAAHEENIIHRDIKPGNIMLDRRGRTVLTDFGIASIVHPDHEPRSGEYIMGTPGYLPPEVLKGHPPDHRGDIFALGAVLYEMLAGQRLVPGRGLEDTARTLLADDFPELGDLDDQVDEITFGALGRMIAPDPDKRFQNYADLLAGLRREQASVGSIQEAGPALDPTRRSGAAPTTANAAAATSAAPATAAVDPEAAEPPPTAISPPPAGRHRAAKYSMTAAAVLALCLIGLGLARLIPERWDQVTALFESPADSPVASSAETAPDNGGRPESRTVRSERPSASMLVEADDDGLDAGGDSGFDPDFDPDSDPDPGSDREAGASSGVGDGAAGAMAVVDEAPADAKSAPVESSAARAEREERLVAKRSVPESVAPTRRAAAVDPEPGMPAPPVLAEARGVLVIGKGDPVLVDPMVRVVEGALRDDGREIVDRGFVPGLASLTYGDEIDLAGLARAATAAGARYAVILRAMPAGQRQLTYYGRIDTLFIVQTETVTYDLVEKRRLGATELEQIDYTVLNATEQARRAIAPRLAAISDQLD